MPMRVHAMVRAYHEGAIRCCTSSSQVSLRWP